MGTEEHTSGGLNNQHKYLRVNGIPEVLAAGFLMAAKGAVDPGDCGGG
jgi:hypothetical protein